MYKLINPDAINNQLTQIADEIRTKTNETDLLLFPDDFITKIRNITGPSNSFFEELASGTLSGDVVVDGITSVKNYAFYGQKINSISFPDVTSIGEGSFGNCSSLNNVNIPNLLQIGKSAFIRCSQLTSIDLPKTKTIGENAFQYCSRLSTVNGLSNITSIPNNCFYSCRSLKTISLPNLKTIGKNGFYNTGLKEFIAPESFNGIVNDDAFRSCNSLEKIDFLNLKKVMPYGLNFDELTPDKKRHHLIIRNTDTVPTAYDGSFSPTITNLYVPRSMIEKYRAADYWHYFSDMGYMFAIEDYPDITGG